MLYPNTLLRFPIYSGWTNYTPVIPKFYWDVYSMEQRIKQICMNLCKMEQYLDNNAELMNELVDELEDILAEIEEIINDFAEFATEHGYTEIIENIVHAKDNNFFTPRFLARLATIDYTYTKNPQSMCMLDDRTILLSMTNSGADVGHKNECKLVKVDIGNNTILNTYDTQLGHCNGLGYNPKNNHIYIGHSDYTSDAVSQIFYIYNADTINVIDTVDLSGSLRNTYERIHSFCFDKVTEEMYMTTYQSPNTVRLYSFDYENNSVEYLCIIPTHVSENYAAISQGIVSGGTQNIHAWNGKLFYLISGANNITLLNIKRNGDLTGIIGIERDAFIYSMLEAQGMDFTDNGDIIISGRCATAGNSGRYNCVYGINYNGGMFINTKKLNSWYAPPTPIYVDASNTSISPDGTSDNPFQTLDEAIGAVKLDYGQSITIISSDVRRDYYLTARESLFFKKSTFILSSGPNNYIHLNNAAYMPFRNVSIQGGIWIADIPTPAEGEETPEFARKNFFNLMCGEFRMHYGTLDFSNCEECGIYATNSDISLSNVTIIEPQNNENFIAGINGRNTSTAYLAATDISYANIEIRNKKKWIGIVGDSFSVTYDSTHSSATNPYHGFWVNRLESVSGYNIVNEAIAGTGFVEGDEGETFVDQFARILDNEHYNEMEYIIIYGGLNDFTHQSAPDPETIMGPAFSQIKVLYNNKTAVTKNNPKLIVAFGNLGFSQRPYYNGYITWYEKCMNILKNNGMPGVVDFVPYWLLFLPNAQDTYFESDLTHPKQAGQKIIEGFMQAIISGTYTGVHRSYTFEDAAGNTPVYFNADAFTNFISGKFRLGFDNGIVNYSMKVNCDSINTGNSAYTPLITSTNNDLAGITSFVGKYTDINFKSPFITSPDILRNTEASEYANVTYNVNNGILYAFVNTQNRNKSFTTPMTLNACGRIMD